MPSTACSMRQARRDVVIERAAGLDFYLDPSLIDEKEAARIRSVLADAMTALEKRKPKPVS